MFNLIWGQRGHNSHLHVRGTRAPARWNGFSSTSACVWMKRINMQVSKTIAGPIVSPAFINAVILCHWRLTAKFGEHQSLFLFFPRTRKPIKLACILNLEPNKLPNELEWGRDNVHHPRWWQNETLKVVVCLIALVDLEWAGGVGGVACGGGQCEMKIDLQCSLCPVNNLVCFDVVAAGEVALSPDHLWHVNAVGVSCPYLLKGSPGAWRESPSPLQPSPAPPRLIVLTHAFNSNDSWGRHPLPVGHSRRLEWQLLGVCISPVWISTIRYVCRYMGYDTIQGRYILIRNDSVQCIVLHLFNVDIHFPL